MVNAATGVDTQVQVELLEGTISIYATGNFDFGSYTVSTSNQTVTGAFTDYFSVEDLKGADSGYYTTLQMSGDLAGPGGATIPDANVSASVASTGVVTITGGVNPRVEVAAGLLSFSALDSATTFIKRDTAANFGVIGHYGTLPTFQVVIPAYQPVGLYTGTVVYTLYEY
ncbi:MAG: hypothetical protein H6765_08270 [Candidatus Peribacteria bacterium]|nr:MAG: hypothetical protein H6765_08270 [Candidatus Peribacteria bacterium]